MTFPLVSAPRSSVTHIDEVQFTLCGTRVGDEWTGQYSAALPSGVPSCKRCAKRAAVLPAACLDLRPAPVAPVSLDYSTGVRHAVLVILGTDSEGFYSTATGERTQDGNGSQGSAETYCDRVSYGVNYTAGAGPAPDCVDCAATAPRSAAEHSENVRAYRAAEERAQKETQEEEARSWEEHKRERAAEGFTFVPRDASAPNAWGSFRRTDSLTPEERTRAGLGILAGTDFLTGEAVTLDVLSTEAHKRSAAMLRHPAGKGRPRDVRSLPLPAVPSVDRFPGVPVDDGTRTGIVKSGGSLFFRLF